MSNLTKKEAWLIIAAAYLPGSEDSKLLSSNQISVNGLCYAIGNLDRYSVAPLDVTHELREAMKEDLDFVLNGKIFLFYSWSYSLREERSKIAFLLADDKREEARLYEQEIAARELPARTAFLNRENTH